MRKIAQCSRQFAKQALPGGQVQTPLGPGDEARRKEQERKGGVQGFLQKTRARHLAAVFTQ